MKKSTTLNLLIKKNAMKVAQPKISMNSLDSSIGKKEYTYISELDKNLESICIYYETTQYRTYCRKHCNYTYGFIAKNGIHYHSSEWTQE